MIPTGGSADPGRSMSAPNGGLLCPLNSGLPLRGLGFLFLLGLGRRFGGKGCLVCTAKRDDMKIQNSFSPFMVPRTVGRNPGNDRAFGKIPLPAQTGREDSAATTKPPYAANVDESDSAVSGKISAGQQGKKPDATNSSASAGQTKQENQAAGEGGETPLAPKGSNGKPLPAAALQLIAELRRVDSSVRAHERAHLVAAGPYAKGAANFSYQRGPDGRDYAVGGEVAIDTSEEASPEQTIAKMNVVRAAALAPADPSPQDRQVAAAVSAKIVQANQELMVQRTSATKIKQEEVGSANEAEEKTTRKTRSDEQAKPAGEQVSGRQQASTVDRPKPMHAAYRQAAAGGSMRPALDIMA